MRIRMRLALALLLAAPFTSALVRADSSDQLKLTPTEQKLDRLQKELTLLQDEMVSLRAKVLEQSIRRDTSSAQLRDISRRLDELTLRLDAVLKQPVTRESGAGPGPGLADPGNGITARTSLITLRNRYSAVATVRINGRAYVIEPNQTVTIPGIPVGTFNYEVDVDGYGVVQPLRAESLRPAGHQITIYPGIGG